MKITLRLILSIVASVTMVVMLYTLFQIRNEKALLLDEIERRSAVLAESLQESVEPLLGSSNQKNLARLVEKFGNRERLAGVAIYDADSKPVAMTKSLGESLPDPPPEIESSAVTTTLGGSLS